MKKLIFSFFLVVIFIFSCGKKGPIELSNYDDPNIKDPSSITDITISDDFYSHRREYEPLNMDELWVGSSKGRNIKILLNFGFSDEDMGNSPYFLKLYIKRNLISSMDLSIGRLNKDWNSSEVTYAERLDGEEWDWNADVEDIKTITDANRYYDEENDKYYLKIDITDYINAWDSDSIDNNGVVIYSNNIISDYDFISFYSKNASDYYPKIYYEFLNSEDETETEEYDLNSDIHIAQTNDDMNYNNEIYLGDGYYPIFEVDFDLNNIDPKWEILEGHLVFKNIDLTRLENSFDINLSDYNDGDVKFYIGTVANDNVTDFELDNIEVCDAEIFNGYFAINVTNFLNIRNQHNNKLYFGIMPEDDRSKFRFIDIAEKPELKIIYRENPEG
ncbi:MAG TPA: DNRLRE domain-containing protein [Candidatus Mcinerneyibacterium sp.]|nr:DNRLRE domain-containing protein [Candidatus Mcinerneyibacterium sp.]